MQAALDRPSFLVELWFFDYGSDLQTAMHHLKAALRTGLQLIYELHVKSQRLLAYPGGGRLPR